MSEEKACQAANKQPERMIEIRLPGCTIFLRTEEVLRLLTREPELWERALKRGKGILRNRQARTRQSKVPARCKDNIIP